MVNLWSIYGQLMVIYGHLFRVISIQLPDLDFILDHFDKSVNI